MPPGTSPNHQAVVAEWHVQNPGFPGSVVDPQSRREVVRIDEPQFNHNAGALAFGPDEFLYIALGDGGGADDVDGQESAGMPMVGHGLGGNGQNAETVLGAILRIDPRGSGSANGKYGIPKDNPFVNSTGADEVFAFGFRNPFRFSFDRVTGQLYAADVGQNDIEEIDLVQSGGNYGWNWKEGSFFFDPNGHLEGFVTDSYPGVPSGLIDPIAQYDHDEGLAVIGGFVYRGARLPQLFGAYVFGDFQRPDFDEGRMFFLAGGEIFEFEIEGSSSLGFFVTGFGQDAFGELYVMGNLTGTPFQKTGMVQKLVPVH
jgi:glucose/arabinose dehydrogenase